MIFGNLESVLDNEQTIVEAVQTAIQTPNTYAHSKEQLYLRRT